MTRPALRTLFLGDRRIAWRVMMHLTSAPLSEVFDIRGLVTGEAMEDALRQRDVSLPETVLRNDARHSDALRQLIERERIDMILSIQHNWILPDDILSSVDGRAYNLHNAKLPDYKGYNSVSHAILNGDETYVSTVHRMVAEVDAGPILVEEHTPIRPDDTALSLYHRSLDAAERAVLKLLQSLAAGNTPEERDMSAGAGVFYKRGSLDPLADITDIEGGSERDGRIRALFFPPLNAAYEIRDDRRYYILPETGYKALISTQSPINMDYD